MTREKEIEILIKDGCTKKNAERHLKNGTIIFDDFEENLETYLNEWDIEEEDRDEFRKMVFDKIPVGYWGIVNEDEKTYYIMYSL